MIWRMSFFCADRSRRAISIPSAVLVWKGPTCALVSWLSGISWARSPNVTTWSA